VTAARLTAELCEVWNVGHVLLQDAS
jgi:hypothetical protein